MKTLIYLVFATAFFACKKANVKPTVAKNSEICFYGFGSKTSITVEYEGKKSTFMPAKEYTVIYPKKGYPVKITSHTGDTSRNVLGIQIDGKTVHQFNCYCTGEFDTNNE